jgi:putative spermidine/putrescine transport system permease protein
VASPLPRLIAPRDMTASANTAPLAVAGVPLRIMLRRTERIRKVRAFMLVAPLLVFLITIFVVPIGMLLALSVENPEVAEILPRTAVATQGWDAETMPGPDVVAIFVDEVRAAHAAKTVAKAGKRLNQELSGFRSLLIRTGREAKPTAEVAPAALLDMLIAIDERWGDIQYWRAIKKAAAPYTWFYLLAAIDRKIDVFGSIQPADPEESIYIDILIRTFWISLVVTSVCLAAGYPLAYLLATLPTRIANLLMVLVLLPFWTSLLVRTTAWTILLQDHGVVNDLGQFLGLWSDPLTLVHNRIGVYVAMTHILLPFMVLPMYSVMRGIDPAQTRAAASLGAPPFVAFLRVYLPQSMPGVGAGCLLVFILSLGYYITPALVGGPKDQMLSYFIAFFTNQTLNWGLASALSVVLLLLVMVLFAVYHRLIGVDKMKLG